MILEMISWILSKITPNKEIIITRINLVILISKNKINLDLVRMINLDSEMTIKISVLEMTKATIILVLIIISKIINLVSLIIKNRTILVLITINNLDLIIISNRILVLIITTRIIILDSILIIKMILVLAIRIINKKMTIS